jgi:DNA-binding transcriptional MerR regulator
MEKVLDIQIPEKLTFRRKEVTQLTKLDGRVLDYWEKEFAVFTPMINQSGEKFYTHRDIEIILKIRELLIVEKLDKNKIKEVLKNDLSIADLLEEKGSEAHFDKGKINRIRGELKEILTILDKSDKK